ncbi:hypothetical protein [Blautia hansenii]|uniref:hypothetical protein n=1 Tax=Blautia hansenii TaxID=1322 RepID=UPI0022E12EB5|nr:hypothetical protein [Blautia hansenii]
MSQNRLGSINKRNECMINDYIGGMTDVEIAKKYKKSINTVKPILKQAGVYRYEVHKWTEQEIKILKNNYASMPWEELFLLLPNITKEDLISKASDLKIKRECYYWTEKEIEILKNGYAEGKSVKEIEKMLNHKHSESAILGKARKMKFKKRSFWTDAEIDILRQNYSVKPMDEICALLPGRTKNSIQGMAKKYNLLSMYYLSNPYTEDEEQFIRKNYLYMTDKEISECIGRTERSVKAKRENMNLSKTNNIPLTDMRHIKLKSFIRKHNYQWRKESVKNCNSKCVITGNDFTDVHHIYSFDLIFNEFLENEGLKEECFDNYSEEQLKALANKFYEVQMQYPLGVCLTKQLHIKFHSIYGYGQNTTSQFQEFVNRISLGEIKVA